MNAALKIDLRKSDPLGLDFSAVYERALSAVDAYKRMGPEDTKKPGWYEHKLAREKQARIVIDFVVMAKLIAQAVGERAVQVPGLKFALEFRGLDHL
jgi:hypothetical protein